MNTFARRLPSRLSPLLLILLLACASPGPENAGTPHDTGPSLIASGAKVASVKVRREDSLVGADTFERYTIADRLQREVVSALSANGHYSSGGELELLVTVVNFRLRSGASAFWLGVMAGADRLGVEVTVLRGEEVVKTYETDTSTALGGAFYTSPTKRSERMIDTLAERIVSGL